MVFYLQGKIYFRIVLFAHCIACVDTAGLRAHIDLESVHNVSIVAITKCQPQIMIIFKVLTELLFLDDWPHRHLGVPPLRPGSTIVRVAVLVPVPAVCF